MPLTEKSCFRDAHAIINTDAVVRSLYMKLLLSVGVDRVK